MTTISAEVVADSIGTHGDRITSLVLTMPRMILAEFNTHRMLSRNSASSRAIPARKMLKIIKDDPFIPIIWQKEHSGMQGTEVLDEGDLYHAKQTWLVGRDYAVQQAEHELERYGVSKQITNRMLETYMWHKVLTTATEWENFYALRAEGMAEPHMRMLADSMLLAMNRSRPAISIEGTWHVPFSDKIIIDNEEHRVKLSTAMAAQTSYTVIGEDGKELDYAKLTRLHDKLSTGGHWSPFEHPAKQMDNEEYFTHYHSYLTDHLTERILSDTKMGKSAYVVTKTGKWHVIEYGWSGNFRGWIPYRKLFKDENRTDARLTKHDPNHIAVIN